MEERPPITDANRDDPEPFERSSISNAPELGQAFTGARNDQLGPSAGDGIGSQQVRDDGSRQNMNPSQDLRSDPDRTAHETGMTRDTEAAELAHLQMLMQRFIERTQGQSHGHSHNQSQGFSR